jgi:uncharacterized membrane protein YfcA
MTPLMVGVGLAVGVLVGLTGVGGGTLLTPFLVLLGIPVPTAVGTDLVYGIATKLAGTVQHARQGSVAWSWTLALAAGGVPAAAAASVLSARLVRSAAVAALLAHALGTALILAAAATAAQEVLRLLRRREASAPPVGVDRRRLAPWAVAPAGAAIGLLVGLTSVGGGSLVAPLLWWASGLEARRLVGTDVASGLLLTAAAGVAHLATGAVDWHVALSLMAGSVPGAVLGSRLTLVVPARPLRAALSALVFLSGIRLV